MAKRKYEAVEPIEHDGARTEPGGTLTLEDEAAAPLVALGHIKPAGPDKAAADKAAAEKAAAGG